MLNTQEETKQPVNTKQMEALHQKHIALSKVAEEKGERVLSESHYQRAEYYLHAMNYPSDSLPTATSRSSARQSHSDTLVKPPQEGKVLPLRGNFLRRNRRNIQY